MVCRACGKESADEFSFCPHCGKRKITKIVCPSCAKESAVEFSFCPHCGKAFAPAPPLIESPKLPPEAEPAKDELADQPSTTKVGVTGRANDIGTYVFGVFSFITLLVSIIKGIVPIYLLESAVWAGAAWYWHRIKAHSELAKAIVIVLAALVAIGEVIQIASEFGSESKQTLTDKPNPIDSVLTSQSPSTYQSPVPASAGATPAPDAGKPAPATLLVTCDLACNWKLDGEARGRIDAGGSAKGKYEPGWYTVLAATEDGLDQAQQIVKVQAKGQAVVAVELKPVRGARLRAEQEQQSRTRQRRSSGRRSANHRSRLRASSRREIGRLKNGQRRKSLND